MTCFGALIFSFFVFPCSLSFVIYEKLSHSFLSSFSSFSRLIYVLWTTARPFSTLIHANALQCHRPQPSVLINYSMYVQCDAIGRLICVNSNIEYQTLYLLVHKESNTEIWN